VEAFVAKVVVDVGLVLSGLCDIGDEAVEVALLVVLLSLRGRQEVAEERHVVGRVGRVW